MYEAGSLQMADILRPRIAVFDFYDLDLHGIVGRNGAMELSALLSASGRYEVVERSEWHRLIGGGETNQDCLLHPAWATQISNYIWADALVIGCVRRSAGCQMTMEATMLDATGIVLAHALDSTVEGLADKLRVSSLVNSIRTCHRPIRARVTLAGRTFIILDAGTASGLKPADILLVDRILETASDPYFHDRPQVIADVTVGIGTAEVMETGSFASLARYMGIQPAREGDLATRLEF
jgi:hypothetical protein